MEVNKVDQNKATCEIYSRLNLIIQESYYTTEFSLWIMKNVWNALETSDSFINK